VADCVAEALVSTDEVFVGSGAGELAHAERATAIAPAIAEIERPAG